MILVDSSVWIDHLRTPIGQVLDLANQELLLTHPFIIGEIALGSLKNRAKVLANLDLLPKAIVANDDEVLTLIDSHRLFGLGIGYADAHLLASTLLTDAAKLWTFDRRLRLAADQLNCIASMPGKSSG